MAKKEIKVNETDLTVPSAEDVQDSGESKAEETSFFDDPPDERTPAEAESLDVAAKADKQVQTAMKSDTVQAWNDIADMLYALERHKPQYPGLHQSRMGRLLERLP